MKVLETSNILKRRDALGRIGGWAPGHYTFICLGCGRHGTDGDKRATQCFAEAMRVP